MGGTSGPRACPAAARQYSLTLDLPPILIRHGGPVFGSDPSRRRRTHFADAPSSRRTPADELYANHNKSVGKRAEVNNAAARFESPDQCHGSTGLTVAAVNEGVK